MSWAFPLPFTPTEPAYVAVCKATRMGNVFYPGETVTFTIQPLVNGTAEHPTSYIIRDTWTGTQVSAGTVSAWGTFAPTAPSGGWGLGHWSIYFFGATTNDTYYGASYGRGTFCIVATDARFPTAPALTTTVYGDQNRVMSGVLTLNPGRFTIADFTSYAADVTLAQNQLALDTARYVGTWQDSTRPRSSIVAFTGLQGSGTPNPSGLKNWIDAVYLLDATGANGAAPDKGSIAVMPISESVDSTQIWVSTTNTGATFTLTISTGPNSGALTQVENYPGLTSSQASCDTVNAASTRVKLFWRNTLVPATMAATVLGRGCAAAISSIVATLYAAGATWFEGPVNEPKGSYSYYTPLEIVHATRLFRAAVKAGNAGAKNAGPTIVSYTAGANLGYITALFQAGLASYIDGFSTHGYNTVQSDLTLGRANLGALDAVINANGGSALTRWGSETGGIGMMCYGVYHPRRVRWHMLWMMLYEQYGFAKERLVWFEEVQTGDWGNGAGWDWYYSYAWFINLNAVMVRAFNAEVYGKPYAAALSFGTVGDRFLLGNRYTAIDGTSVVAVMAGSPLIDNRVTFTVSGTTSPITVADKYGNTSTLTQTSGRITVSVLDVPTYLRLPSGVTLTPYSHGSWPAISAIKDNLPLRAANGAKAFAHSGTSAPGIIDNFASAAAGSVFTDPAALPAAPRVTFTRQVTFDRVMVFSGWAWQNFQHALVDFDVQTSTDGGGTWTTQATVTRPTPTSIRHGDDQLGTGCYRETWWDEMWVYDLPIPRVTANAVRVYVRAASYGGEPDATIAADGSGQGDTTQKVTIQQLLVYSDDIAAPRYVTVS